jgi:hypothetical protein
MVGKPALVSVLCLTKVELATEWASKRRSVMLVVASELIRRELHFVGANIQTATSFPRKNVTPAASKRGRESRLAAD